MKIFGMRAELCFEIFLFQIMLKFKRPA